MSKWKLEDVMNDEMDTDFVTRVGIKYNEKKRCLKSLFDAVCEVVNDDLKQEVMRKKLEEKCLEDCVLNNVGLGKVREDNFSILRKNGRKGFHAEINGKYEDPDQLSYKLYQYAALIFNDRIKKSGLGNIIDEFCVAKKNSSYCFCLSTYINTSDNETVQIELGGDWIISWEFVWLCERGAYDVAMSSHTVLGHVFWPNNLGRGKQSVNQARGNRVSIKNTLEILKECYMREFIVDVKKDSSLYKAFCYSKDWFQCFGVKQSGFERYISIFCLEPFLYEELTSSNVKSLFDKRRELVKKTLNKM